ncbi:MAG: riboflavin biosynthesis protein RibF [Candidatus Latescibacteria bacterium 4484_7]|nr:MAG: riboflavin biosynthesis protein RibF [Candidatus Latescibacteria bacterium 4484_7]
MRIVEGSLSIEESVGSVVTIGVFDGVHIGHRKIIERVIETKRLRNLPRSVLYTFRNHPLTVTHPEMAPPILTTLPEKLSLLEEFDLDVVLIEDFSTELAGMNYREFINDILIQTLRMRHLVVGYDFHLGKNREGSQKKLAREGERMGFGVTIVPPVVLSGTAVSSTRIRKCIKERHIKRAAKFLGHDYFFDAVVVEGEGVGRRIDFPTANLRIDDEAKLLPPDGVYAVKAELSGEKFAGMMNIGRAPTIRNDERRTIEVHLLGLSKMIYGERIRVHFAGFIRGEEKFENADLLREQLKKDKEAAIRILQKNGTEDAS